MGRLNSGFLELVLVLVLVIDFSLSPKQTSRKRGPPVGACPFSIKILHGFKALDFEYDYEHHFVEHAHDRIGRKKLPGKSRVRMRL